MSLLILPAVGRRVARSTPVNLVVDGNSISTAAYSSIGTFDNHLVQHEPLASVVTSHSCFAVSGHTWANMTATHGPLVDAAWVDGATNVLVAWETTNTVTSNPNSVTTALTNMAAYTAARRAVHPGWLILHVETIPCGGRPDAIDLPENQNLVAVDAAVRADVAGYGFDATVNLRTHPAFNHDGSAPAYFEAYPTWWDETRDTPPRYYLHPTDPGKAILSPLVAAAVASLIGVT